MYSRAFLLGAVVTVQAVKETAYVVALPVAVAVAKDLPAVSGRAVLPWVYLGGAIFPVPVTRMCVTL